MLFVLKEWGSMTMESLRPVNVFIENMVFSTENYRYIFSVRVLLRFTFCNVYKFQLIVYNIRY